MQLQLNGGVIIKRLYKAFIYTSLSGFTISVLIPVLWVFAASVKENHEFYKSPWALPEGLYLQNFADAWNKAKIDSYFLNSVIVTVLAIVILLIVALPAAYALSRFYFRGKRLLNGLFMAGLFINVSYIVVPIFLMLVDGGDIIGNQVFLNNRLILAVIYAATALPFTVYLLSGYMRTIPMAYEEAASVDGAGYFRTMIQIIFPMAKPSIVTVILFNFLSFWNEYIIALTLMTDDSSKTLPVGLMNLMKAQNAAAQYGQLYAGAVIVMLPTLILYIIVQKKLLTGISVGGIKG